MCSNNIPNDLVINSIYNIIGRDHDKNIERVGNLLFIPSKFILIVHQKGTKNNTLDTLENILCIESYRKIIKDKYNIDVINIIQTQNSIEPMWDDEKHNIITYGNNNKYNIFHLINILVKELYLTDNLIETDFTALIQEPENMSNENTLIISDLFKEYINTFDIDITKNDKVKTHQNKNSITTLNTKRRDMAIKRVVDNSTKINELIKTGLTLNEALSETGVPISTYKYWMYSGFIDNEGNLLVEVPTSDDNGIIESQNKSGEKRTNIAILKAIKTKKEVDKLLSSGECKTQREALERLNVNINTWKGWKFQRYI